MISKEEGGKMGRKVTAWLWAISLLSQPGVLLADGESAGTDPVNKVETYALSLDQAAQSNPAAAEGAAVAAAIAAENSTNLTEQVSLERDIHQLIRPDQPFQETRVPLEGLPDVARRISMATNAQDGLLYARNVLPGAGGGNPTARPGQNMRSLSYPDGSWIDIFPGGRSVLHLKLENGGLITAVYDNGRFTEIGYRESTLSGWLVYRPAR